jgi:hypothetical protein
VLVFPKWIGINTSIFPSSSSTTLSPFWTIAKSASQSSWSSLIDFPYLNRLSSQIPFQSVALFKIGSILQYFFMLRNPCFLKDFSKYLFLFAEQILYVIENE